MGYRTAYVFESSGSVFNLMRGDLTRGRHMLGALSSTIRRDVIFGVPLPSLWHSFPERRQLLLFSTTKSPRFRVTCLTIMPSHHRLIQNPTAAQGSTLCFTVMAEVRTIYEAAWFRRSSRRIPRPLPAVRPDLRPARHLAESENVWYTLPDVPFDAALVALIQNAAQGIHTGVLRLNIPVSPDFRIIDITEASCIASSTMTKVLSPGQALLKSESPLPRPKVLPTNCSTRIYTLPHWLVEMNVVKSRDKPLFFFLCESLQSHTPNYILARWDFLRQRMFTENETIAILVRRAEQEPRIQWTGIMLEFYFLLLDHTEALTATAPTLEPQLGSLELQLSALAIAIRIEYYLFRMTRDHRMCGKRAYRRQLSQSELPDFMKELDGLLEQELARMQEPGIGHFQSTERELIGEPVKVDSIASPAPWAASFFCSICQDSHPAAESVKPHNCQCIFGENCLGPILNRDVPFSNACPNCRTQLHEPLQWCSVLTREQRDWRTILVWNLRSNLQSLKKEINADPDPFTPRERIAGWAGRLLHGLWGESGGGVRVGSVVPTPHSISDTAWSLPASFHKFAWNNCEKGCGIRSMSNIIDQYGWGPENAECVDDMSTGISEG
ncbi:uncharacterized protein BDR25DRAFT_356326 [Lindgomyces ingoldianus]|uniref:Uncharacterized protein n=1 Tax=Lindgomyces ingoldianus TaxID=673940 RepID=A0ACB6QRE6_9PLEO|nr:uncharacterized protein BDR25DRAFT_356326 [Lindgomyces ingoldianus]KAF2469594.1 hypothetical protein BDR25DRAFT_356326 [Lindgomyces ingoldianus]